ncbi:MAG: hypothetical protein PHE55_20520, partial [Methylococcaceae bacterium]|nr:hypothetical protein [Methylococcaceae bacterium]
MTRIQKKRHETDVGQCESQAPFAFHGGELQSRGRLWSDARALAEALPDRPYLFNLCEDRYLFCLTLLAAMLRGQICLLPSSAQEGVLWEILRYYPEAYLAAERVPQHSPCLVFVVERPETGGV